MTLPGDQNPQFGDPAVVWWLDEAFPLAWDTLYLADNPWPGICNVSGSGLARKIDVKSPKGEDGATFTDNGYTPAEFDIKLTVWSRNDWAEVLRLLPLIHPKRKGGIKNPVWVFHPAINMLGVFQVFIDKISCFELDKAKQMGTLSMHAMEWMPEPKPVQKGGGAPKPAEEPPDTPYCGPGGLPPDAPTEGAAKTYTPAVDTAKGKI